MEVNQDRVKALMDQVREIHESPENQARARYWQVVSHERWEPALIRTLPAPRDGGKIPFVVEPALTMWSEILGFDTAAYYADPLTYLTAQLEMEGAGAGSHGCVQRPGDGARGNRERDPRAVRGGGRRL